MRRCTTRDWKIHKRYWKQSTLWHPLVFFCRERDSLSTHILWCWMRGRWDEYQIPLFCRVSATILLLLLLLQCSYFFFLQKYLMLLFWTQPHHKPYKLQCISYGGLVYKNVYTSFCHLIDKDSAVTTLEPTWCVRFNMVQYNIHKWLVAHATTNWSFFLGFLLLVVKCILCTWKKRSHGSF